MGQLMDTFPKMNFEQKFIFIYSLYIANFYIASIFVTGRVTAYYYAVV